LVGGIDQASPFKHEQHQVVGAPRNFAAKHRPDGTSFTYKLREASQVPGKSHAASLGEPCGERETDPNAPFMIPCLARPSRERPSLEASITELARQQGGPGG
jgi:hypothetical protein